MIPGSVPLAGSSVAMALPIGFGQTPVGCLNLLGAHLDDGARWQLDHLRDVLEGEQAGSGHVLATEIGTPVDPSNFRRRFATISQAAGIKGCHPHELRHTAASLMLSRGVPLHVVADVLGHSSISVTKDVYGHLVAGEKRLASDAISSAIYGA